MGSSAAPNLHNVFVYGSLLADDVVRVLLNRVPDSSSALLNDLSVCLFFQRFSIKGRVYPAILPVPNKSVTGRVLLGITDPELDVLDVFEDVEYQRTPVHVSLTDTSHNLLQAHAYVWTNQNDPDLYGDWDFQDWQRVHMNDFIKMTTGFVQELELPESKPRVATYESYYHHNADNPPTS